MNATTKVCRECHVAKPLGEFYLSVSMKDGHLNYCKACTARRLRAAREQRKRSQPTGKDRTMTDEKAADYCPKAPDHVHVVALSSVSIEYDADAAYVDVSCAFCGRSGCLAKVDVDAHVDW